MHVIISGRHVLGEFGSMIVNLNSDAVSSVQCGFGIQNRSNSGWVRCCKWIRIILPEGTRESSMYSWWLNNSYLPSVVCI